jgi:GH25 family lysozyme M1 (1,4-beta-N-acetylmuramidase)
MRATPYLYLVFALASCMVGDPPDNAKAGDGLGGDTQPAGGDDYGIMAKRVCAAGTTTAGIDVSYYQGTINWTAVKNAGIEFAFVRVSDGDVFHDPKFDAYWAGAKAAGLVRGAYQFFRPNQSITAQADMMIAAVGTLGPGDLPPVIDVEATGGLGPSSVAAKVRQWVDRVKAGTGVDPVVYTGKYFWRDQVGGPSTFVGNPLWIAQYTSLCPDLPLPWTTWAFWQYSESGHVAGIAGAVDLDRFNGSVDELRALAGGMPADNGGGGTSGGGGDGSCASQTMGTDMPAGTCVQAAADQKWYRCDAGTWTQQASTSGCTASYGWCNSATLGHAVPPRTCVEAASDNVWYQCDGTQWATPVDPDAGTGPAGLCSHSYPL